MSSYRTENQQRVVSYRTVTQFRGDFFTNDSQCYLLVLTEHTDRAIMPVKVIHAANDDFLHKFK